MIVKILIGVIITGMSYMIVPLIFLAVNLGKFEKKNARKIAIWNSIIVGLIFCICTIIFNDSRTTWNVTPAFLYYFINCAVLGKKPFQKKEATCKKGDFAIASSSLPANNNNIVERNEIGVGNREQSKMLSQNRYNFREKKTKKVLLIIGLLVTILIIFTSVFVVAFKYYESQLDSHETDNTEDADNAEDIKDLDNTDDVATKTWFLRQYDIAKQQYLNELKEKIVEKEKEITELKSEIQRLNITYQKEIKYIKQEYAHTSDGILEMQLKNAERKYNAGVKECVDKQNTLNKEITAIGKEVRNPNVDSILAVVAKNCNITSKEAYTYYYKYLEQ